MMDRRTFVRAGVATATVGAIGTVTLSGAVAGDHDEALPDHVSLTFPRDEMERYRPLLSIPSTADFKSPTWYGWKASSPEYELDCYVYFAFLHGQRGWTESDSHQGDREPFYCFVDPQNAEVRKVVYTGWHWMAARSNSPNIYDADGGHHPTARMFKDHHHFALTDTASGQLFDVEPLGTDADAPFIADGDSMVTFEEWLADGWEQALHPGAAQQPWLMESRDSWWRDGTERWTRTLWGFQLRLASIGFLPDRVGGAAATSDLAN